ncbi:hypothetical protein [Streptomyces sp. 3214.6]|uniref:hypothetical protein n=1 Tax=Streptomyces sp. 3214.6 TaxID=1882757 RepID=UPI00117E0DE0|nr:hypothetical protein [Streptomyces sp. 3214.6]
MADLGGASRALIGTYKGAKLGKRTITQRSWFKFLLRRSIMYALVIDQQDVDRQRIREATDLLFRVMAHTPIPDEPDGFFARISRWFRKKTHAVFYPKYEGTHRSTFQDRIGGWAKLVAESHQGKRALSYAQFDAGEETAAVFAKRFQLATEFVLRDALGPESEALNHVRDRMLQEIELGRTEAETLLEQHRRNQALKSAGAGATGALLSAFGFNNNWYETIGFGVVGLAVGALSESTPVGLQMTQVMAAARREALSWLRLLANALIPPPTRRLPGEQEPHWLELLPRVIFAAAHNDRSQLESVLDELQAKALIAQVIESAERAKDGELLGALTEVQRTLRYKEYEQMPDAIQHLIFIIRQVPFRIGGYARPEIASGETYPQIRRAPDELEGELE